MYRKVSFKDGSRLKPQEDRHYSTGDRPPLRLPEQKLASLRELIKHQSVAENRLLGDSDFRLTTTAEASNSHSHAVQSNIQMRRLHSAVDPIIPMTSSGMNVVPDEESLSPVRTRKVARKMMDGDDEENLPATPLLPGKIRVESLKQKPKYTKIGDKSKSKPEPPGALQKVPSVSSAHAKADAKKLTASGLVALANSALPSETEGAKARPAPSAKRIRNEEDIKSFKRGLEVAWQSIGPPPPSLHPKKKSPEKMKKGAKSLSTGDLSKKAKISSAPAPEEAKSKPSKSGEDNDYSENFEEDSVKDSPADIVDDSKLPASVKSLADELRAALKNDEDAAKAKDAKQKVPIGKPRPLDDKNKSAKEVPCVKKSRPVTDREAIRSYIKQQRLARHSAEQQRRAEQARLEREKQARLQALFSHQHAVAKIPVRELLPEGHTAAPRISLRLPSSIRVDEDDKSLDRSSSSESSTIICDKRPIPIPVTKIADQTPLKPRDETLSSLAEPSSAVPSAGLIPDPGRTRRVCAILESALSLQVKLRAEVDRVERFVSSRGFAPQTLQEVSTTSDEVKQSSPPPKRADQARINRRSPPYSEETLSSSGVTALAAPQRNFRDSSTSPIFFSPERRDYSALDQSATPTSKASLSPKQVRITTPEMPTQMSIDESTQMSPLSTAPVAHASAHVGSSPLPLLPMRPDRWNVANVLRRSFGIGTDTSMRGGMSADAALQTTFMGSPPRFTSDVGVQSGMTPIAEASFMSASLRRSRPDLVEACIQTGSPKPVADETAYSAADESISFRPLSPRPSRVSEILKEEAETERVPVEELDARLHAELDLLASLDGYHRQLDDLERSRIASEQNTDVAGLVSLMNAVESHVRTSIHHQQFTGRPASPARTKSSASKRPPSASKKDKSDDEDKPPRSHVIIEHHSKIVQTVESVDQSSVTALEMRQDIERRFQALEAATGRRLAEDSERLLEAHLRTSIAVSDLTRQLADMQRASLRGIEERQVNIVQYQQQPQQQAPPPPPPVEPSEHHHVRYHRRQTFSPPRPPPLPVPPEAQSTPAAAAVAAVARVTASTPTITSATGTPRPVSELRTGASSSTRSVEESGQSGGSGPSEGSLGASEEDEETPSPSPLPTKEAVGSPQLNTSTVRRVEDHKLLCELIAQQARQSALRFRSDIAELTLREREAKRRANNELALIERQKKSLANTPENKHELDRLDRLRVKILTSYAKEKKHLESLKKSSTRLASEQRSLADQLRRSLPATLNTTEVAEESLALSESALSEQDQDLSLQIMQLEQMGETDPVQPKIAKAVVEQLLTGREQMLEERQAIAEKMLMKKAQLDAKEREILELEHRLAKELATPSRQKQQQASAVKEKPSPLLKQPQPQMLIVPTVQQPKVAAQTPRAQSAVSVAGCTDDDVASLPESISQPPRTVHTEQMVMTPGGTSTTAPPIPSSSMFGLGEVLNLEKQKRKQQKELEESIAEVVMSSRPATVRSTTPAATVVSEDADLISEDVAAPVEDYEEDDFEQEKSSVASSKAKTPRTVSEEASVVESVKVKTPRTVSEEASVAESASVKIVVDTQKVETLQDELQDKRQKVKELKAVRDEIRRRRETERVRAKEAALATKLSKKEDEIRLLEAEIENLQAASETEQSIATETEESLPPPVATAVFFPPKKSPSPAPAAAQAKSPSSVSSTSTASTVPAKGPSPAPSVASIPAKVQSPASSVREKSPSPAPSLSAASGGAKTPSPVSSVASAAHPKSPSPAPSVSESAVSIAESVASISESASATAAPPSPPPKAPSPVIPIKPVVDDDEDDDFFIKEVVIPKFEDLPKPISKPPSPVPQSAKSVSKADDSVSRPKSVSEAKVALDVDEATSMISESLASARSVAESVRDAKSVSESIHEPKSVSESVHEPRSTSESKQGDYKADDFEPESEMEFDIGGDTQPATTEFEHTEIGEEEIVAAEKEEEAKVQEESEDEEEQVARNFEDEIKQMDDNYSESFSRAGSTRHQAHDLVKDVTEDEDEPQIDEVVEEEVVEELVEVLSEPAEEEEEDNNEALSESGGSQRGVFLELDLGMTMMLPDNSAAAAPQTPIAPPPLDTTYTVSSAGSEAAMTTPKQRVVVEDEDATPKLPAAEKNKEHLADTVIDDLFPDLVKEAIDSAVFTVNTSPTKQKPNREPLPPDNEGDDKGFEEEEEEDEDKTFSRAAEVASRLRSMSSARAAESAPFMSTRRQAVPKLVRDSVEHLWNMRNEGQSFESASVPENIGFESETSSTSSEVKAAESQFSQMIFDTAKFLFEDLLAKKGKIAPPTADEVYRVVFAQIAPFVGLSVPGASASGIPQRVQFVTVGRRRDAVDEVILSELYSEPSDLWCDFSADEVVVREEVASSLLSSLVDDLMSELEPLFKR